MASIMGLQQPAASQDTVDYTGYLQSTQCHQVHGSQANGQIQPAQKSPSNDHNTSFTSTKGLLNGPGQNNCFLNSAVQRHSREDVSVARSIDGNNFRVWWKQAFPRTVRTRLCRSELFFPAFVEAAASDVSDT
ncbi:hypothetical protein K0M31_007790 [Melipona bicolor]|uniref:Uncharacterized protein n=1 Tax=Melipona bicolor TaxID=60889 RepID=A0AA40GCE0_9HYME|nr:hypothetical protein K0M31_007790 [Melipona bicolor]